jgi:uncharacterized protein (TIGR02466 family)
MITTLFPTSIYIIDSFLADRIKDFQVCVEKILDLHPKDPGKFQAQIATTFWYNQQLQFELELAKLVQSIIPHASEFANNLGFSRADRLRIINMWANRVEKYDYHQQHNHHGSLISGVYYLQAPETADIVFTAPDYDYDIITDTETEYNQHLAKFQCVPGRLILFKGTTKHGYNSHRSDTPKISIAFNIGRM